MFSKETLEAVVEGSIDGVLTIDARGRILAVNRALSDLFGYEEHEMIGQNVSMLMPEPYHSRHDMYLGRYAETGEKNVIGRGRELVAKKKNGAFFPIFLTVVEVETVDGRQFAGVIHDISGRKLAETAYRETDNKFKAILATAVDGIIIIDQRGRIDMVNEAAQRLFGYAEDELIGRNVKLLMPEPDSSRHDAYMEHYHQTGERRIMGIGREVKGRRKDGSEFPFSLGVSELRLRDKVMYVGIIHDLTTINEARRQLTDYAGELKKANENLEQEVRKRTAQLGASNDLLKHTNQELEAEVALRRKAEEEAKALLSREKELNELKSRFVSMASHEFRTPLAGILTSVSLLARYEQSDQADKRKRHMDIIRGAVHNLTAILNDFLSLEKLESGRVDIHPELFPLLPLMEEFQSEIQGMLKAGQVLEFDLETGLTEVWADRHLLRNILTNLVSNAIKYSFEGGRVTVVMRLEGGDLRTDVVDRGMGIPAKDQPYMFDRLFRASNVTNIQGTGLGLNIVRHYLDLHGGTITFVSTEGEGTTFTFRIPQRP
jgi:two-component system sensor kinase FixL